MEGKKFLEKLKSLEGYENIDLDRLTLIGVKMLENNGIEPTYENIVVTIFKLFPKRFSLFGFSHYPDAKRIHDCLWHCTYKTKMWLIGNAKSGFRLTNKGRYILEETEKNLKQKKFDQKYISEPVKRKEWYFINSIKNSSTFQKFLIGKKEEISNHEMRVALKATEKTSDETLFKNLNLLLIYAEKLEEKRVIEFLIFVKEKMKK